MNHAEFVRALPLAQLAPSPFQPRRAVPIDDVALTELADSIRANGILQPIIVRPIVAEDGGHATVNGARYEIIAGHRRAAAAQIAGLAEVPAIVRAMTDAELRAAHLVENLQRENLRALEEAEACGRLRDDDGLTAREIGARIGKKEGVVHNRLKLLELCPEGKAALMAGRIGAEVATLIARIPSAKLQTQAFAEATDQGHRGEPRSYREIRDLLTEKFTLRLSEALFDRADAQLVPNAGACTDCIKRSGGDPHLFSDQLVKDARYGRKSGAQLCNDPDCFAAKKAAHLKRQAERLAAQGKEVVTGAAARAATAVVRRYNKPDTIQIKGKEFVPVEDVRAELKKAKADVKPIVIQDPRTGKTAQAVRRADLEAAGVKIKPAANPEDRWEREQQRERERRAEREAAAAVERLRRRGILDAVRDRIRTTPRSAFDLQLVARVAYAGVDYDAYQLLAELWGEKDRSAMDQRIGQLGLEDLTRFVLDCALVNAALVNAWQHDGRDRGAVEPLLAAAKHYGVDVRQFAIAAPAEKAEGKAKRKKKAAAAEPEVEAGDLEEALEGEAEAE